MVFSSKAGPEALDPRLKAERKKTRDALPEGSRPSKGSEIPQAEYRAAKQEVIPMSDGHRLIATVNDLVNQRNNGKVKSIQVEATAPDGSVTWYKLG